MQKAEVERYTLDNNIEELLYGGLVRQVRGQVLHHMQSPQALGLTHILVHPPTTTAPPLPLPKDVLPAPRHLLRAPVQVTIASPALPVFDEVDIQRAILQLQEQVAQLRRRLDDPQRRTEENYFSLTLSPLAAEAGAPFLSNTGPFTPQPGPSNSSDAPPEGRPSSCTPLNSDSLQTEEQAKEKRRESAPPSPSNR
ncbi:hypothetical protein BDN67DRAFT_1070497 [Paxillus ammoniavirescens]|nr:hypothetical protein BDN67DRAFT_1070497 [Paxillus ammoniavirescens]